MQGVDVAAAAKAAEEAEDDADLDYILENAPVALDRARDGLGRVAAIVRSMKEFAHPDRKEMALADLNQAIQSTLVIASNEYKYVAEVETQFGELPMVNCYAGEINQVVLNLIVNAAHAIDDVVKGTPDKGRIRVSTRVLGNDSRDRHCGHRQGNPAGSSRADLRSLLHHQGSGQGHGAGTRHRPQRGGGETWRHAALRDRGGQGHHFLHSPAHRWTYPVPRPRPEEGT